MNSNGSLVCEFLGVFIFATIVGSSARMSGENQALRGLVIGMALFGAILLAFSYRNEAHLNPALTIAEAFSGNMDNASAGKIVLAQVLGACAATKATTVMSSM